MFDSMETEMFFTSPVQRSLPLESILGFRCCSHTRWTVSRSAEKMSFCAKTMLTASLNDGAAMTCSIVWITAMRRTVVMV